MNYPIYRTKSVLTHSSTQKAQKIAGIASLAYPNPLELTRTQLLTEPLSLFLLVFYPLRTKSQLDEERRCKCMGRPVLYMVGEMHGDSFF